MKVKWRMKRQYTDNERKAIDISKQIDEVYVI